MEHIEKHRLPFTQEEYIAFADEITRGTEGMHECSMDERTYTIVVKGSVALDKGYGIVRSIRNGIAIPNGLPTFVHNDSDVWRKIPAKDFQPVLKPYELTEDWEERCEKLQEELRRCGMRFVLI